MDRETRNLQHTKAGNKTFTTQLPSVASMENGDERYVWHGDELRLYTKQQGQLLYRTLVKYTRDESASTNYEGFVELATTTECQTGTDTTKAVTPDGLTAAFKEQSWTQDDTLYIATDEIRARDSGGLLLRDDSGTQGINIFDGGAIGVGPYATSATNNAVLTTDKYFLAVGTVATYVDGHYLMTRFGGSATPNMTNASYPCSLRFFSYLTDGITMSTVSANSSSITVNNGIATSAAAIISALRTDDAAGTITTGYNFMVLNSKPAGTITNVYQIYDGNNASGATINYFLYSTNATNLNYLAGNTSIGTTLRETTLHVGNNGTGTSNIVLKLTGTYANASAVTGVGFSINADTNRMKGALWYAGNGAGYNRGDFVFGQNAAATTDQLTIADAVAVIKNSGRVGFGAGMTAPAAQVHVDQSSTTGAIPVLTVDQADVSEEFIRFVGTSANAVLTQSIVEAADVSVATIAGYLKCFVQDDGNQLTDQAYYIPIYTLA